MKRILSIIAVVLLFMCSGLIFWAGLSPKTFFVFFRSYPVVSMTAKKIGVLNNQPGMLSRADLSEPIASNSGQIIINNSSWNVEIANNDVTRTNGLSNRRTLYHNQGMLFVFDEMGQRSFWMKDMIIPIDIIFFDDDWKIVKIENDLRPSSFPTIYGNDVLSRYILEVNAGQSNLYNLSVGDQAQFINK